MADTPNRPEPKGGTGKEGPLFQGATGRATEESPATVLSSNFTVGPLLARGALLPVRLEGDAISSSDTGLRLRWSPGALPATWVSEVVASARNVIPIAIRLRPGHAVRSVVLPDCSDAAEAICLSDVEGMAFRTEKERERFQSLEFSNYDLSSAGISLDVDLGLFEGGVTDPNAPPGTGAPQAPDAAGAPADDGARSAKGASINDASRAVRSADCLTGLIAFLLTGSPGRRPWMHGVQRVFMKKAKGPAKSWPERIASAALGGPIDASPVDKALLTGIIDVLRRYPVEGGWPGEQALAEMAAQAKSHLESQDERAAAELDRWAARANYVLASKAEPQSLADDGFVLQRAALLLLLRGDLDGLAGADVKLNGAQHPGTLVWGTAGALAALRTGLRALPTRYKMSSDMSAPGHWLEFLGEVFVALLQTANPTALVPSHLPEPVVTYRPLRTLQGEWIASVASKEVVRTPVVVDRGLERLLTMGQHLGFEFHEHGDNGLVAAVSSGDGRKRNVYLELIRTDGSGPMVRFSTPALMVMGVVARPRMTRDMALDLLRRNADPGMNCRFAINDDATEVVVLVDQLLATLDDAEFLQHIQHVARVAEEFDLSRNVGTVSDSWPSARLEGQ